MGGSGIRCASVADPGLSEKLSSEGAWSTSMTINERAYDKAQVLEQGAR